MNQYRVSLWIENQGSIPDVDLQFQGVGLVAAPDELAMASMFLSGRHWVRLAMVEALEDESWECVYQQLNVSLLGADMLSLSWT